MNRTHATLPSGSPETHPLGLPAEPEASAAKVSSYGTLIGYTSETYPVYEPLLLRNHPSKVYYVTYALYDLGNGLVRPKLISAPIVDMAIVN